jgi:CubicO group peptidase (beta-lactamase class C family)
MKQLPFILFFSIFSVGSFATSSNLKDSLEIIKKEFLLPSLSGAYLKNGEVEEIATVGVRKNGDATATTIEDKHHLGSCGKSMTATLAALLIEQGYFKWNSTLKELLPEIQINDELKNVTFELLLSHRSGLRRDTEDFENGWLYAVLESELYSPTKARQLVAEKILFLSPEFKPQKEFKYSNIGYMIAGYIMEHATSTPWEELMDRYIFKPLQMNTCGFGPSSNLSNTVPAQPWGHKVINTVVKSIHDDNPPAFGPAGTIHCSLKDWGKYLNEHIKGFNAQSNFLKSTSFKKLHSVYPAENSNYTYGGWIRLEKTWADGVVLTHTGTNTYNFANVWLAPKRNSALMSTTNIVRDSHTSTNKVITDIINRQLK